MGDRLPDAENLTRPPSPPVARVLLSTSRLSMGPCERCGADVAPLERLSSQGLRHFYCQPVVRAETMRRIEAMQALHRSLIALATVEPAKRQLERELPCLPDIATMGDIVDVLHRVRLATVCAHGLPSDQRAWAVTYLERLAASL
jgi:hypothetical protein